MTTTRPISSLKPHPQNPRAIIDHDILAGLVTQIAHRGLDPDRAILINEKDVIIRGHLRTLAFALAALSSTEHPTKAEALEQISALASPRQKVIIHTLCYICHEELEEVLVGLQEGWASCPDCGELDPTLLETQEEMLPVDEEANILTQYKTILALVDEQIPVVVRTFENEQVEYEFLLGDMTNAQKLTRADFYAAAKIACAHGTSIEAFAQQAGLSLTLATAAYDMLQLPEAVANNILKKVVSFSAATLLLAEPEGQRRQTLYTALQPRYGRRTLKWLQDLARHMAEWDKEHNEPTQMTIETLSPRMRYARRLKRHIWQLCLKNNAAQAWMWVAESPWNKDDLLDNLADLEHNPLPASTCDHCNLQDLLLATPVLPCHPSYPCQHKKGYEKGCPSGIYNADPFFITGFHRMPELAHQVRVGNEKGWADAKLFASAMEQWVAQQTAPPEDASSTWQPPVVQVAAVAVEAAPAEEEKGRPVDEMRQQIHYYMHTHMQHHVAHPWAIKCADCAWNTEMATYTLGSGEQLDVSCNWAKRRRKLAFGQYITGQGESKKVIPYCRQYTPRVVAWPQILIPQFPGPSCRIQWSQAALHRAIEKLASRLVSELPSTESVLLHLCGRPQSNSDNYRDWFNDQYEKQKGDLSVPHLAVLFEWLVFRWETKTGPWTQTGLNGWLGNTAGLLEEWHYETEYE